ncbi:hypothetical protein Ddc_11252 [Ditylenchus destructor]|nr:hypothetical protein Ddc_11252 [Ditylenchus destructor]
MEKKLQTSGRRNAVGAPTNYFQMTTITHGPISIVREDVNRVGNHGWLDGNRYRDLTQSELQQDEKQKKGISIKGLCYSETETMCGQPMTKSSNEIRRRIFIAGVN